MKFCNKHVRTALVLVDICLGGFVVTLSSADGPGNSRLVSTVVNWLSKTGFPKAPMLLRTFFFLARPVHMQ